MSLKTMVIFHKTGIISSITNTRRSFFDNGAIQCVKLLCSLCAEYKGTRSGVWIRRIDGRHRWVALCAQRPIPPMLLKFNFAIIWDPYWAQVGKSIDNPIDYWQDIRMLSIAMYKRAVSAMIGKSVIAIVVPDFDLKGKAKCLTTFWQNLENFLLKNLHIYSSVPCKFFYDRMSIYLAKN